MSEVRVAFVMPGIGVVGRGAEAFVVELATALRQRQGFAVTLFSRGDAPPPWERVHALDRDTGWVDALYGASRLGRKILDTLFLDPLSLEWYTAALSALPRLWRHRYDVVVMEGGLVGAWACRLLRRSRGSAFVDIAHGNSRKWEGAFARQRPDRVVVFTRAAAAMIAAEAPQAAIEVIPHGVDLARFRPDVERADVALPRPLFLTAGAVDSHKRMASTVEAVAHLDAGSLVVLGDGPEASRLDALAAERLPGRYLRRRVPRERMPAWYAASDVFTLASITESFGLVYLEAMACGLPCVAPDEAVRREVVGEAGLFCDVTSPQAYAETLREAAERDWGALPRRRAEAFPIAATVDAYERLFRELAA